MTFAGYNPEQALVFWERMREPGRSEPPEILSDHPSTAHRIQALRRWIAQAVSAKQAYDAGDYVRK
jgi:predicted Zn-dependent protease